jgi:hypothetical protein
VTGRPLIPVSRGLLLGLTTATAGRSLLAAGFTWFLVLAAVYAADAGPPLPAMAFTAALLLPVAAWAAAAVLAATGDDLRALLTAADGRLRALLIDGLLSLLTVVVAAVLGVAAALLFDPHPASAGDWLLGGLLHLLCGAAGTGLALLLHAWRLSRGVQALLVVAVSLLSGRLRWLPPDGPVLAVWGTGGEHAGTALVAWALAGPVLATAALVAAAATVRRRRC